MIKPYVIGGLMLISASAIPAAQVGPGSRPQAPSPTQPAAAANAQVSGTTLVGCLYREDQVPGRSPNPVERAGVLEDYILADASMPSPAPKPGATSGATGTTGSSTLSTGNMYKVENIPDERLKALVGKRVEVVGRIDPEGGTGVRPDNPTGAPTADKGPGPDKINLPELEASSIREVAGTCPTTPAPRSR